MLSYCLVNKINNKKPHAGRYCFTFWYDWCYSYTFVLDSYVETTKHWVPGTGHGHRFVITVHGCASETNVLIIYSSQLVGVWLLRSFPRKESHLWEMFVLSHVASSPPTYMFWFFFYSFLFDFQVDLLHTNNHWHFHFSKPILETWLDLPHLGPRTMTSF